MRRVVGRMTAMKGNQSDGGTSGYVGVAKEQIGEGTTR